MAWNEPGGSNNDKDPWTGKPKQTRPPDLEAFLRNFRKKLTQLFNKKAAPAGSPSFKISNFGIGLTVLIVVLIWVFWGIFIVGPAEQAVILRFGKYVGTVNPGPHWVLRPIESAYTVNEQRISTYSYNSEMLTQDQNIVSVAVAVQYRIDNARNYLFSVVKPVESLQQATASALRQVIGHTNLDQVLTSGREQIRQEVQDQIAKILAKYQTGLLVTDVAIQPAKAPDEVKEAFDDAIKAQEDEQRFENQAQAYAMQVVPIAKGQAQRLLADAKAYQQQVVLHAQADTAQYLALLPQYENAPAITRERLYLETMQNVLANNSKVLVDTNGNNNIFYLPLDKLLPSIQAPAKSTSPVTDSIPVSPTLTTTEATSEAAPTSSSQPVLSPRLQGGYQ